MSTTISATKSELAHALFEESGDALFLLDPETDRLLEVNPVALRLTGFSRNELLQYSADKLFRFESSGGLQRIRGAFNKTTVFHSQDGFLLRTKGDAWVPVNLTISRLHVQPKTLGLIIARDDRERRAALQQARRVEAELRTVLGSSPAALWSAERLPGPDVTVGWQFRYVSPLLARLAGRPEEYFDHPLKWAEAIHASDRDSYRNGVRKLLTGTAANNEFQYRVVSTDGAVRWVRDRLQVVRDPSGRPVRLDCCVVDVTDQRQAEEALRQSEQRFRALVEKSRDGIMLIDERGQVRYATAACRSTFGYDPADVSSKDFLDLLHPEDRHATRKRFNRALAKPGEDVHHTARAASADGSHREIEMNLCNRLDDPSVRAVVMNYRDITEQTRLEDQLRQSHKLEAVGRLAGGIAHDFNNLLTVILGNLELARSGAAEEELSELLGSTERAARQAADLTKQMLGFARRQPLRTATLDLNAIVQEAVGMLRRTIDPRITIQVLAATDLKSVAVDPVQIQQVLMNLCLNARDAMPEGGTITVETTNAEVSHAPGAPDDVPGRAFVRLSVADTGVGMSDEVRAKIFEPFFTTKDVGQGTGLGLAVVYGVAQAHGGWVECASTPGQGSRFDVFLPRGITSAEVGAVPGEPPPPAPAQGETILLADDEPLVRALARTALEHQGYRVLAAADGAQAVEMFSQEKDTIDLVVLDASMPVMSGLQASAAIRRVAPQTRILFASGYPLAEPIPDDITGFLHKPYTPTSLAAAVRQMLDNQVPAGQ